MFGNGLEILKAIIRQEKLQIHVENKSGILHIRRGGSWRSGARLNRSSFRGCLKPDGKLDYLGFRLALVPID